MGEAIDKPMHRGPADDEDWAVLPSVMPERPVLIREEMTQWVKGQAVFQWPHPTPRVTISAFNEHLVSK